MTDPQIQKNRFITFLAPEHGGHCAFISVKSGNERFWAEQCVVEQAAVDVQGVVDPVSFRAESTSLAAYCQVAF